MDRALLGRTEKFLPLLVAQVAGQRQGHVQAIDACALLTCIAIHGDLDAFHRNILVFRIPKRRQRRARAQRCIVEVMGIGSRSLPALLHTDVGGNAMSIDVDLMPHRRALISDDSNGHDFDSLTTLLVGYSDIKRIDINYVRPYYTLVRQISNGNSRVVPDATRLMDLPVRFP